MVQMGNLCSQVNMSVAVLPMSRDLGWTGFERGLVNSAFFYGYAATQIPAGWVSTKCAPRSAMQAWQQEDFTCASQWPVNELEWICICRIGGAKVLLAGVFLWSLGTLVAPPCAKLGVFMQQAVNLRLCTVSLPPSAGWCGQHPVSAAINRTGDHQRLSGCPGLLESCTTWLNRSKHELSCFTAGILALCASRVLVGLGEGLAPSAATSVLAATIPE